MDLVSSITHDIVLKLLRRIKFPKHKDELAHLKRIVHRTYETFVQVPPQSLHAFFYCFLTTFHCQERDWFRREIANIFIQFADKEERPTGIAELLEVCAAIIQGFDAPLKVLPRL